MKFSVLILGSVSASHFRAGSVTFLQSKNPAEIIVERTRSWRLEAAGIFHLILTELLGLWNLNILSRFVIRVIVEYHNTYIVMPISAGVTKIFSHLNVLLKTTQVYLI